jgi:hypothetical protein
MLTTVRWWFVLRILELLIGCLYEGRNYAQLEIR